jgi:glycine hydroxymethyltransferase
LYERSDKLNADFARRGMTGSSWGGLFVDELAAADPEVADLIEAQRAQNRATVNLVASESYCPESTIEAEASELLNKNASGYPPRVSFGGGDVLDRIELLAIERAKRLFGAEHANVQALSSTIANVAVLRALLKPGERILAFDAASGGHGSHGHRKHLSGQDYAVRTFGVDGATGAIDYDAARRLAREHAPKLVIAGSSAHPRAIDFRALAAIADEAGALLFADIAHVAGLVIAGLHDNPVPYSAVVTTSTHKTFCGPRTGGLVLCKAAHGAAVDAALAPGLQAAPGGHIIAARAVLFELVRRPEFTDLMRAVVANAKALGAGLLEGGARLYAGGTDTHMVVVDLRGSQWTEAAVNDALMAAGVIANTTGLPARGGARLALRLGSTPMTIRGMGEGDFHALGTELAALLAGRADPARAARIGAWARAFLLPYGR